VSNATLEVIGVVGFLLNFVSFILLAHKHRRSWHVRALGTSMVLGFNIAQVSPANIFGSSLFLCVTMYGLIRWSRADRHLPVARGRRYRRDRDSVHLRNLLARIHRDGGHYLELYGLEKAVIDADAMVARLHCLDDEVSDGR
jgi:Co/Zn/Cd efflux system component